MIGSSFTWASIVLAMAIPSVAGTDGGDCGADNEQPSLLQISNVEAQFSHEDVGSHGGQNGSMYQDQKDCQAPTSRGKCCQNQDLCQMIGSGKEFQWCCTTESNPRDCNKWDHCSSDGKTSNGWYCTGDCGNHGKPFRWCYTAHDGKWDYCVPEVLEKIKSEREKQRQKSGSPDKCIKDDVHGWYDGIYEITLYPDGSPDGLRWTWVQCASRCAEEFACEFWTLQMNKEQACLLMSNKKDFHADPYAISGGKKNLCQA